MEGTGALSGINVGDIDLNDSGVYGAKVGYFMPRRVNWLGVEMEAFNTTPHLKQTALTTGAHLRVTTLAFNVIARVASGATITIARDGPPAIAMIFVACNHTAVSG